MICKISKEVIDLNILVTNDDGISSELLLQLVQIASGFGTVYVAAPDSQCSAMSQHLTINACLTASEREVPYAQHAWSISGTPADCVKLSVASLLPVRPDYVFSGINRGCNTGFDASYSGTIGAAKEALMNGIPAFAFSVDSHLGPEIAAAAVDRFLPPIISELLPLPIGRNALWNVNLPALPADEIKGIQRNVRLAPINLYKNGYTLLSESDGQKVFLHHSAHISAEEAPENTDVFYLLRGWITIGQVTTDVLYP